MPFAPKLNEMETTTLRNRGKKPPPFKRAKKTAPPPESIEEEAEEGFQPAANGNGRAKRPSPFGQYEGSPESRRKSIRGTIKSAIATSKRNNPGKKGYSGY
jgi:hypothetical protein